MSNFTNRRVFINKKYQLFTFIQEKDGSIYASWPDFVHTKWMLCKETPTGPVQIEADLPAEGKFTVHGSGMTGFREHKGRYDQTILFHGNHLINPDKSSLGLRHLFTAQIPEPTFIPQNSPYLNRKSDYNIDASQISPAVLTFFALPKQNFQLGCRLSFDEEYIIWSEDREPKNYLGSHIIELGTHVIVWIAYQTTNMFWPTHSYIFYDNGFKIPIVLGKGNKEYLTELRVPQYSQDQQQIIIAL